MDERKPTPLEQNCDDLADMILKWYAQKVQERYYMRDIYNQLARCATSIGANVAESKFAQSDADYKTKMHIALKEANETKYWIKRMVVEGSISNELQNELFNKLEPVMNILISLCKKN